MPGAGPPTSGLLSTKQTARSSRVIPHGSNSRLGFASPQPGERTRLPSGYPASLLSRRYTEPSLPVLSEGGGIEVQGALLWGARAVPLQQQALGVAAESVPLKEVPQQIPPWVACPASMRVCGDWPNVALSARTV